MVLIMIGGGECLYDGNNDKDGVNTILLVVTMMMMVVTRTMVTMKTTSNAVVA